MFSINIDTKTFTYILVYYSRKVVSSGINEEYIIYFDPLCSKSISLPDTYMHSERMGACRHWCRHEITIQRLPFFVQELVE